MASDTPLNRREFLNYIWAASIALFMAGSTGMAFAFAHPRQRRASFRLDVTALPAPGSAPLRVHVGGLPPPILARSGFPLPGNAGLLILLHLSEGLLVLDPRCTHLGCVMPASADLPQRYQCPCHGAQFQSDGRYVAGPAPRDMDRYRWQALDAPGNILAKSDGHVPMPLPSETAQIRIWIDAQVKGAPSRV